MDFILSLNSSLVGGNGQITQHIETEIQQLSAGAEKVVFLRTQFANFPHLIKKTYYIIFKQL